MKRISIIPALAVATLAACSDPSAMTSERSLTDAQFAKNNPPANAQSVFDLAKPEDLKAIAIGSDVHLTWNPTLDDAKADCTQKAAANDQHPATECNETHFEVFRDGAKLADVKTTNSYVDAGLEPGTYTYWVKVKGMEGQGSAKPLTHHSLDSDPATVTVGDEPQDSYVATIVTTAPAKYTIEGTHVTLQKTGDFVIFFTLAHNGTALEDCTTVPFADVSATATYATPAAAAGKTATATASECAYHGQSGYWRYKVTLPNLANNQVATGTLKFTVAGVKATPTYTFETK
jgi:uncharacterized protein (DUF427 family)